MPAAPPLPPLPAPPPPEYFLDACGQRHVRPYAHTFRAYCKARWLGRPLHAVFCAEFASHDAAYFSAAIALGCITVNGRVQAPGYALRDGDRVEHCLHRHEPPVPGGALRELRCAGAAGAAPFLAICKPAGVPTHACGAHRHLAVPALLAAEAGHAPDALFTVHRLDRVTSGVLLLGRSREEAAALSAAMRGAPGAGPVRKRYLALVRGAFPQQQQQQQQERSDEQQRQQLPMQCFAASWEDEEGGSGGGGAAAAAAAAAAPEPALRLLDLGALDTEPAPAAPPCPWLAAFEPQRVSVFTAGEEGEGEEQAAQAAQASAGPGGVAKARSAAQVAGRKRGRAEGPGASSAPAPCAAAEAAPLANSQAAAAAAEAAAAGAPPPAPLPAHAAPSDPPLAWTSQGYLRVHVPLRCESYKHAVHGVAMTTAGGGGGAAGGAGDARGAGDAAGDAPPPGAPSTTLFRCIAQCRGEGGEAQTLVEAIPLTGRSHQIRVHLAYLGHAIHDDPVYCAEAAAALRAAVAGEGAGGEGAGAGGAGAGGASASGASASVLEGAELPAPGALAPQGAALAAALARVCAFCTRGGARAEFSPMQRHVHGVSLHALEYCGWGAGVALGGGGGGGTLPPPPQWRAATPVPAWGQRALARGTKSSGGTGAGP
jgi:23S rRNA-/tRNA-specific pseudouridylate synthase